MNNEDFITQPKARFVHPRLGFKQAPKLLKNLKQPGMHNKSLIV
jgi:hypothetical protein